MNDYELQIDILTDMADIQRSQNKSIFDAAIELFVNKYVSKKNAHIKVFLDYFLEYWYKNSCLPLKKTNFGFLKRILDF